MAANHEEKMLQPVLRGGASLVSCKPVFSPDSKCVLLASASVIRVCSVTSGECIRELCGHKDRITSMKISSENQFQLLTCSLDQTIIKWDYQDGILLKQYKLGFPLYGLFTTILEEHTLLAIKQSVGKDTFDLIQFILPKSDEQKVDAETVLVGCGTNEKHLAVGCNSNYVASICPNQLTVCSLRKDIVNKIFPSETGKTFTCVTCHPTDQCIATGCSDGKIFLWRNVFKNKCVKTVSHWHALAVQDVTFTAEGSYFLSGGHECVLVKWQYNSQDKDPLPRLGAAISAVTVSKNNTLYATCHDDNVVQIISSSFKVVQIFQGLTRGHLAQQLQEPLPAGLMVDPRTKALVTNGRPGHVQFYSLHSDKQLYNLDIVGQNYVSPQDLEDPLVLTEVENVAFSYNGDWLITIERRDDGETTPEMRLKVWKYDEKSQQYSLNTCVDSPHQQKVVALKFQQPSSTETGLMAVTTSTDGKFKLWEEVDDTDIYRTSSCWNCESVGYYRDHPAGDADFSEDGSLLAVAFNMTLTLWDPQTNALRMTLPQQNSILKHVLFGTGGCSHLLVCTTEDRILVWNLLVCAIEWTTLSTVVTIARDPCSENLAVFNDKEGLIIIKPSSSVPVYSQEKISLSTVVRAIFIPHVKGNVDETVHWQKRSRLYYMNKEQELLTLQIEAETRVRGAQSLKIAENIPQTPFSLLMSNVRKTGVSDNDQDRIVGHQGQPGSQFLSNILGTPAHVLPPISSLCMSFIDTLLLKKNGLPEQEEDSDIEESSVQNGDVSSDSETEHMEVDSSITNEKLKMKTMSPNIAKLKDNSKTTDKKAPKQVKSQKKYVKTFKELNASEFDWIKKLKI